MKCTKLKSVSPKRRSRVGKLWIVRLVGKDIRELRMACYLRDRGNCQHENCLYPQLPARYDPLYDGDPLAYDMAHIQSRGAGGSDVLDNVVTKHHACHMEEHQKGRKP